MPVPARLFVRVVIGTSAEEILAFKCCRLPDMNLEVRLKNEGGDSVAVSSAMDFFGPAGSERVENFFPFGLHTLGPGDLLSFFTGYDQEAFRRFERIGLTDRQGRRWEARITGEWEEAELFPA